MYKILQSICQKLRNTLFFNRTINPGMPRWHAAIAISFLIGVSTAKAQSSADLESELFGETPPGSESQSPTSETPAMDGQSTPRSESPPLQTAGETSSQLLGSTTAIGGRADFLLLSRRIRDEPPSELSMLAQPTAYVFLDSRPRPDTRGYLRVQLVPVQSGAALQGNARAPTSPGAPSRGDSFDILELWMKWQPEGSGVFWTIGRQPIKWGSGTLWNPTDFLSFEAKDPLAFFDDRGGSDALRAQIPFEDLNANLSLVAAFPQSVQNRGEPLVKDLTFAVRAEIAAGSSEWAATAAWTESGSTQFGLDLSTGLGPVDLDLEGACTARSRRTFFKRVSPVSTAAGATPPFENDDRNEVCLPQGLAGLSWEAAYSDTDSLTIGAEYFWNGLGHNDAILELAAALSGNGTPLYLAEQYAGAYILAPAPFQADDWTFQVTYLKNLSDFSDLYRTSVIVSLLESSRFSMGLTVRDGVGEFHLGEDDIRSVLGSAASTNDLAELTRSTTPDLQVDATFSVNL